MAQERVGYLVYNICLALTVLLFSPLILFRMVINFAIRLTVLKEKSDLPTKPVIWIHAASEGQIITLAKIYQELTKVFTGYQLVVTCTGNKAAVLGESLTPELRLIAFPYSVEFCSKKIITYLKPKMLLMIDNCFYPNLIRNCKKAGSKIALIGGRVNKGLSLVYRLAPGFVKSTLARIELLIMTSVAEANQVGKMGANLPTILVSKAITDWEDWWEDDPESDAADSLKQAVGAVGNLLGGAFEAE